MTTVTRKPAAILLMRFTVLAICFRFLALVSSSYSSSSLSSVGVGVGPFLASPMAHKSEMRSRRDAIEFCNNISSNTDFRENQTSSTSPSSMPVGLSARGGEQEKPQNKDEEEDGDEEDDGLIFEEATILLDKQTKKRRFLNRRKIKFLNRIAEASSSLLKREDDANLEREGSRKRQQLYSTGLQYDVSEEDDNRITQQSDLTRPGRYVHIVTTAALPWMTGTSVNPLLRAAYMHERLEAINHGSSDRTLNPSNSTRSNSSSYVTLVIPWLELPEDQRKVYNGRVFDSKDEQELYVRKWLAESANMPNAAAHLKIVFYNARYHADLGSVFAMGDIIQELPPEELDVCVLEEPEHLNWFRAPSMKSWTKRYNYVVGIVHTNYDQYAAQHYSGWWTAPAIRLMSAAMVRAYCHKVIKLSAVVQDFAPEKEITSNVHGVRQEFIAEPVAEGNQMNEKATTGVDTAKGNLGNESCMEEGSDPASSSQAQVYFIGKLLWTKGLDILLEYQDYYKDIVGEYFPIDIYGTGPDELEISRAYLGRPKTSGGESSSKARLKKKKLKSEIEKVSKNAFVRVFTWANRRRKRLKRNKGNESSNSSEGKHSKSIVTVQDIYNDVIDVMESLPLKARESFEGFPTQLKESLDQLSEDVTKAQESFKGLPSKARMAINQLIDELSSRTTTFPLPRGLYQFRRQPIPATFPGRVDHAALKSDRDNSTDVSNYKVFVNPSVSEVLCTTTAEALAMGKFVIIPIHPSNEFFTRFPNCLGYRNQYEFVANLRWALTHDPVPHTPELAREFTWEAATDRFLEASAITHKEARERELLGRSKIDERIAWFHNELGKGVKGDILRKALGAGPVSGQVKYEMTKRRAASMEDDDDEIIGDDEEDLDLDLVDEGLPRKFRNSVFVRALQEAIESSPTITIE
jgi:digalactosyldiacylglycerol synthase